MLVTRGEPCQDEPSEATWISRSSADGRSKWVGTCRHQNALVLFSVPPYPCTLFSMAASFAEEFSPLAPPHTLYLCQLSLLQRSQNILYSPLHPLKVSPEVRKEKRKKEESLKTDSPAGQASKFHRHFNKCFQCSRGKRVGKFLGTGRMNGIAVFQNIYYMFVLLKWNHINCRLT